MGYESWDTLVLSPSGILLDPKNPRLPGLPENATQDQVLDELFSAGKVRDMVKSIAKSGFYPDQRIVVIRRESGRGFIAIEGNRRVSACQVLLNPDKCPDKHARYVKKWSLAAEPYRASFEKIPVVVAPSRLAATRLLASRHLNEAPVIGWSRYAQGRFAINAFSEGQEIGEIMDETGLSESDLRASIQEARIFDLFLGLSWTTEEKGIIEDNIEKFPIEALRRLLRSKATSEALGQISFDQEGWINFAWESQTIEPILKRFMYDALTQLSGEDRPELTSRTLNDSEGVKKYLSKLPSEIRPAPSNTVVSAKSIIPNAHIGAPLKPVSSPQPKAKPPARPRKKIRIAALPGDMIFGLKNDKALALLEELQAIVPEEFPCATGLLLRSLLEIALIARIKKVSRWADCMAKFGRDKNVSPSLDSVLKFAETCDKTIPDINLRKSLPNQQVVPRILLNLVAHNDQHVFVQTEARDAATKLTPLLRELLKGD